LAALRYNDKLQSDDRLLTFASSVSGSVPANITSRARCGRSAGLPRARRAVSRTSYKHHSTLCN